MYVRIQQLKGYYWVGVDMDTVRALACALNVAMPMAYREAQQEIAALRREVQRLQAEVEVLHENIRVDRNTLDEVNLQLDEALDQNQRLTAIVYHLCSLFH